MPALIDSGFVISLLSVEDRNNPRCAAILKRENFPQLPSVTLPEIAHILIRNKKRAEFVTFLRMIANGDIPLIHPEKADIERAAEIMVQYADANIDFVDCAIMAMAERLNISRILTVDQRDFRMFRPKHIPHFTILP